MSGAKVHAGALFFLYAGCPVSRQDLPPRTVASGLTLPLTVLRDRKKITAIILVVKPGAMVERGDTHGQIVTGARAGRTTTAEHGAWHPRAWRHCQHTHGDTVHRLLREQSAKVEAHTFTVSVPGQ